MSTTPPPPPPSQPPPPPPSQPPPPPNGAKPAASEADKPWWKRWWGITIIAVIAIGVFGTLASDPDGDEIAAPPEPTEQATDDRDEATPSPEATPEATEPEPTTEPEPSDPPEPTQEPEPEPIGYGNGTWRVGDDIPPGTYRSNGGGLCYWERMAGFSGEFDDIITNGNNAPEIVTIDPSDAGFQTQDCGDWVPVEDTFPEQPETTFGDGTYVVGEHIAPGQYRSDGGDDLCYWARLSNFSHAGVDGIITNGNSPTVIEIASGDAGFTTVGCGNWTQ